MVFVGVNHNDRREQILRSVDSSIKRLLTENNDPLSLSCYLFVLQKHGTISINGDSLVSWGRGWGQRVMIDWQVGSRVDESVASAALAFAVLNASSTANSGTEQGIERLKSIIDSEIQKRQVLYNRQGYAAIILWAAKKLNIQSQSIDIAIDNLVKSFVRTIPTGQAFGLSFLVEVLWDLQDTDSMDLLKPAIGEALSNPENNFEDVGYLSQSLWYLLSDNNAIDCAAKSSEEILRSSPVWPYLAAGSEDIIVAGNSFNPTSISHLYRAALLDIAESYTGNVERLRLRALQKEYGGSKWINVSAFLLPPIVIGLAVCIVLYFLIPVSQAAHRFWILNEVTAMTKPTAVLYVLGWCIVILLTNALYQIVRTLYPILIQSNLRSDLLIKDTLSPRLWTSTRSLAVAFFVIVVIGVLINLIAPSVQHLMR